MHQKFGTGTVTDVDGNKLTIDFDEAAASASSTASSTALEPGVPCYPRARPCNSNVIPALVAGI